MNSASRFQRQHLDPDQKDVALEQPNVEQLQSILSRLSSFTSLAPKRDDREIRIRNFRSDRLELTDDLLIVIEDRDDQYIANSYDTGQYSLGCCPDDAIQNLCSVIEDYYDLLREDEERLSEALRGHLRYLRAILRDRQ
jgi:hypothetical protein